jgi:predicted AAA+ superfamily ATPase
MKRIVMRPMSMWESGDSDGTVSLSDLFNDTDCRPSGRARHSLTDIAKILCRGGWPEAVTEKNERAASKLALNYVNELTRTDIISVDGIKRNSARARSILRAYARIISSSAPIGSVVKDVELKQAAADARTVDSYVNAYRKLYVIEDIEAWSPKLRSKATVRHSDTRQFVDPSIAAAALGAGPADLIKDLNTFGLLFESLVIRDLRVYAEALGGAVYNYRDSIGLEADAIIHLDNGKWGAVEVKLGGENAVNQGAKNLQLLRAKVDTDEMNPPSFLLIVTASGFPHKRGDGVYVVPIGCLKN